MKKPNAFLALNVTCALILGIRRSGISSTTELRFCSHLGFGRPVSRDFQDFSLATPPFRPYSRRLHCKEWISYRKPARLGRESGSPRPRAVPCNVKTGGSLPRFPGGVAIANPQIPASNVTFCLGYQSSIRPRAYSGHQADQPIAARRGRCPPRATARAAPSPPGRWGGRAPRSPLAGQTCPFRSALMAARGP
jgi:hypothetical protein